MEANRVTSNAKHRERQYLARGASLEVYRALEIAQQGECAICGRPESGARSKYLALDHDHATGGTRGLLCSSCNLGLGKFGDSPVWLRQAALYIEENR